MVWQLWKTVWQFLKVKHRVTRNFIPMHPRELKTYAYKNFYMSIHSDIIHNSHKVETILMPINWWLDKHNMLYPYKGILFTHESNEVLIHATIWKNHESFISERSQTQKPHIVWIHLFEMSRIGKAIEIENRLVVARDWKEGKIGSDCYWVEISFGVMKSYEII